MRSRSYFEPAAATALNSSDIREGGNTMVHKRGKKQATVAPYHTTFAATTFLKPSLRIRLGTCLLSPILEILNTVTTGVFVACVVVEFALREDLQAVAARMDAVNIALLGYFAARLVLLAGTIGYGFCRMQVLFELAASITGTSALCLNLRLSDSDWRLPYFLAASRVCRMLLALSLASTLHSSHPEIKKGRVQKAITVEVVADRAKSILQRVMDQPWVRLQHELLQEVRWCYDAVASNTLSHTIVTVSDQHTDPRDREVIDIVNRFSQGENKQSFFIPRINSDFPATDYHKMKSLDDVTDDIRQSLATADEWTFDVFQLHEISEGKELLTLMMFLVERDDLLSLTGLDESRFINYVNRIQAGYNRSVIYHNATHAADVTQSLHFLLRSAPALALSPYESVTAYIAAMVHDFEHPGLTNQFLISTQAAWAITYNDRSVLENHHVSAAFAVAMSRDCDIFSHLLPETYSHIRAMMIGMVLATDSVHHFTLVSRLQSKFVAFQEGLEADDRQLGLEVLLHAADISNPARPWALCERWALLILREFWQQGDREEQLGLPFSYLADRAATNVPKSQLGFIDVIVEPLFEVLKDLCPRSDVCWECLMANRRKWKEQMNDASRSLVVSAVI